MMGRELTEDIIPAVAVPYSDKTYELATRWGEYSQIKKIGIRFILVKADGDIVMICGEFMSYGHYSDDPLEDFLFRDDVLRIQEDTDKEIRQYELEYGTDRKGSVGAAILMLLLLVGFFLWFFFG